MSDLYRSALSARIAKLPPMPPSAYDDEDYEEGDEEEEANDSLGDLPGPGMGPPAMPARTPRHASKQRPPNPAYAPISAAGYFSEAIQVSLEDRQLDSRVYYMPPQPQSSGASGVVEGRDGVSFRETTVLVCHHGAGYSGLSFACFAKEVEGMTRGECGVLAMDARRHGKTKSTREEAKENEDLSIDTLVQDFVSLLTKIFPDPEEAPTLLLIGHSMGGSVITRSCPILLSQKYRITGVVVIDVVEGSAIEALPHMHSLLNARPDGFGSLEEAVEWHVQTKTIRNTQSARISIPPIFVQDENPNAVWKYIWRTPLRSTAPYWMSWFTSLSSTFLSSRTARLLILAGTDRLDQELMIGQMQGKFQLEVIQGVGHMVQEDDPRRLAELVVVFWRRNERLVVGIKGVKKVGEV